MAGNIIFGVDQKTYKFLEIMQASFFILCCNKVAFTGAMHGNKAIQLLYLLN